MFQRPRGTRDFLPDEMERRRYIESRMRETFKVFGYREVQTPTFEHLELFTAKSGESIVKELYAFKDKGGRDLALRPELTTPVIRMYCEKLKREPKPLKLFYFGSCYRYDRPQRGRYREFTQAGCEIIGYSSQAFIAELIALAQTLLENVGLKDYEIKLGNLDFVYSLLKDLGLEEEVKKSIFPLIDKKMFEDVREFLEEKKVAKEKIDAVLGFFRCNRIEEIKKFIRDKKLLQEFEETLQFLEMFDVKYTIDTAIVRGLDYYKGVVFEVEVPKLGAEKQICGGGSYELLSLFGEESLPTAGFAMGFDRILVAIGDSKFPIEDLETYVVPVSKTSLSYAIDIAKRLRSHGIRTDIDLNCRGLNKALRFADSRGIKKVIIVGDRERKEGKLTVRDMESGEQKILDLEKAIKFFSERTFSERT